MNAKRINNIVQWGKNKYKSSLEARELFLFTALTILAKLISVVTFFYMTRKLNAIEIGTAELFNTNIALFIPLISLQIHEASIRFFSGNNVEKSLYSSMMAILCVQIVFTSVISLIYHEIALLLVAVMLNIFMLVFGNYARAIGKVYLFRLPEVIQRIIIFASVFFLIQYGARGYIYATIIGASIAAIFLLVNVKPFRFFSIKEIKKENIFLILKYTVPFILNAMGWWAITSSDRYMINFFYSTAEVGVYSVSVKIASTIMLVLQNVYFVYQKKYITLYDADPESLNNKTGRSYFFILYASIFITLLLPQEALDLLFGNPEFKESVKYFYLFCPSVLYWGLAIFFGLGYTIKKQSVQLSITTLIAAGMNILLNYILIQACGIQGAIIASIISLFIWFIIRYIKLKDIIKYKFKLYEWLLVVVIQLFSIARFIMANWSNY